MKNLTINGAERSADADTVAALVDELQLSGPLVLVELNGLALLKSEWAGSSLRDGDRIEILKVSAGG